MKRILWLVLLSMAAMSACPAAATTSVLELLDLSRCGMDPALTTSTDTHKALESLLLYYRGRSSPKHPVDRTRRQSARGHYASSKDLKAAQDALKHILIGQPVYPPRDRGTPIDWANNPYSDKEWIWQLNRMPSWEALAQAYWHTGQEQYAREWAEQFVDWVKRNPRDGEHAYAWRSIEAGIRAERFCDLYQHFIDSPSFTPEVLESFLLTLDDHASYLMTTYHKGSNWALMEAEGLAFIGICFPEFKDAPKWRQEAFRRLGQEITRQVRPDGHQVEQSISYHGGCIRWFWRTYDLARLNGLEGELPKGYCQTLERMVEVIYKLALPDGSSTQFGDSWAARPGGMWTLVGDWAGKLGRADLKYFATRGKEGLPPQATAFALPDSGFYSMRSAWNKNAICMVLKCGPDGGGHCQPDNMSFELYGFGRNLMPDSGCYIYSGNDTARRWFRQSRVHQTLTLNNENIAYAPKLLLWKPSEKLDALVVENASYPALTHRRSVLFVDKRCLLLVDDAIGTASGQLDLHFQLAPGEARLDPEQLCARSGFSSGANVLVVQASQPGVRLVREEGQVSFVYTKKQPRPAFAFETAKDASTSCVRLLTLVLPYQGKPPKASLRALPDSAGLDPDRARVELTINGKTRVVGFDLASQTILP